MTSNSSAALLENEILSRWREAIIATYSEEAHRHLQGSRDLFSNPIGQAILRATEEVLEYVLRGNAEQPPLIALDDLIRIRTVQDFVPSQALSFILDLKIIFQEAFKPAAGTVPMIARFEEWMKRIDLTLLTAFDVYTLHREKLADIRVDEFRRRFSRMLKDSRLFTEESVPNGEPSGFAPEPMNLNGAAL